MFIDMLLPALVGYAMLNALACCRFCDAFMLAGPRLAKAYLSFKLLEVPVADLIPSPN